MGEQCRVKRQAGEGIVGNIRGSAEEEEEGVRSQCSFGTHHRHCRRFFGLP